MSKLNAEQIKKALENWIKRYKSNFFRKHAEDALALITSQEQRIEAYRQELAEVRVALAEANKERQELIEDLAFLRSRADETIDALHSQVRELTAELEKRPPRLIITRKEPK